MLIHACIGKRSCAGRGVADNNVIRKHARIGFFVILLMDGNGMSGRMRKETD